MALCRLWFSECNVFSCLGKNIVYTWWLPRTYTIARVDDKKNTAEVLAGRQQCFLN